MAELGLKGFMVGNGIIGHRDSFPGANKVYPEFLHNKAFISDRLWAQLEKACAEPFAKPGPQNESKSCGSLDIVDSSPNHL